MKIKCLYFILSFARFTNIGSGCLSAQEFYNEFHPGKVWYDKDGNPINAHGGDMLYCENTYYWFGQIMTPCGGDSEAWVGVSCYSSTDLYNWNCLGVALQVKDNPSHLLTRGCSIDKPKVIYNRKTGKFVMFWHYKIKGQGYGNAMTGITVSNSAKGPFEFVRVFRSVPEFLPDNIMEESMHGRKSINYIGFPEYLCDTRTGQEKCLV